MPNPLIHYAVGAAALTPLGFRGRERALMALWAVAPDLDAITMALWLPLAPHVPLGADAHLALGWTFTHRGLSHTLLGALLVGGIVGAVRRDHRLALGAGVAWSAHFVADLFTPWRVVPFWPFSDAGYHWPVIVGSDPFLMVAATVATLAMLAQTGLVRRVGFLERRKDRLATWGRRWDAPAIAVVFLGFALALATLGLTAAETDAPIERVHPAGLPATVTMGEDPEGLFHVLEHRRTPWSAPEVTVTERVQFVNTTAAPQPELALARCLLPRLGPYSLAEVPVWSIERLPDGRTEIRVLDAIRNATKAGGPALIFTWHPDVDDAPRLPDRVELGNGVGDQRWFRVEVPRPIVEDAECL